MKDGFANVYIPWSEFVELIMDNADIDSNFTNIVVGRPRVEHMANEEIIVPIAFSDTDVNPLDWDKESENGIKVQKLSDSWKEK